MKPTHRMLEAWCLRETSLVSKCTGLCKLSAFSLYRFNAEKNRTLRLSLRWEVTLSGLMMVTDGTDCITSEFLFSLLKVTWKRVEMLRSAVDESEEKQNLL